MGKRNKDIISKIIDSGLIQEVKEYDGLFQLSFAFEIEYGDDLYYYNSFANTVYRYLDLDNHIQYFGILIVDNEGYIQKGILESIIYDRKNKFKELIFNPTQVIAKNDKIHLSRLYEKNCLILPYCQTNSSTVWLEAIKFKGRKNIKFEDGVSEKYFSISLIWRYVGREDYISYDILERKLRMEQCMLNTKMKMFSSALIAKAINNHGDSVKEAGRTIGLSNIITKYGNEDISGHRDVLKENVNLME